VVNEVVPPPTQVSSKDLTIAAIFGLSSKGEYDWSRLRGLHEASLAKFIFQRVFVHVMLAVFVAQIYLSFVNIAWIGLWVLGVAGVHVRTALLDRKMAAVDQRSLEGARSFGRSLQPFFLV